MNPPQIRGFQKYGGHFSGEKQAPAATYPQVRGLVPRSCKVFESQRGGASRYAGGHAASPPPEVWGAGSHTAGGMEGVSPPVKTIHGSSDPEPGFRDQDLVFLFNKYEIWFELGPYGSVGAHIKTGQRYVPQDNFKTLLAPKTAME